MLSRLFFSCFYLVVSTCSILAGQGSAERIIISVPDQKMVVMKDGVRIAQYPISTSRFGLGDRFNSYATPLGSLEIAQKIGADAPEGTVFKGRRRTGEVLSKNAAGRDPIVTRILWLRGLEGSNRNAHSRGIYIHGTPVERQIGRPVSYGCIRMKSKDVVRLFDSVNVGARIEIVNKPMSRMIREFANRGTVPRFRS